MTPVTTDPIRPETRIPLRRGAHCRRKGVRALALLESIIALAIVAVVLLGIMAYYLNTSSIPEREKILASSAARKKLEEIQRLSIDRLPADYPAGSTVYFDIEGLKPAPPANRPGSVTVDYTIAGLAHVVVQVQWKGIRANHTIPPQSTVITLR
jgi:hypothetical protein